MGDESANLLMNPVLLAIYSFGNAIIDLEVVVAAAAVYAVFSHT